MSHEHHWYAIDDSNFRICRCGQPGFYVEPDPPPTERKP